jgi:hypothetical protein
VDEHRATIAATLELYPPSKALNERAPFAVPPARLPMKQLPQVR